MSSQGKKVSPSSENADKAQLGLVADLPILNRGVQEVLPSASKLAQLMERRKIRLYLGIDPTGNQLTLGHAVVLKKLQQFVEAGHEVILLIGNATVRIGDPTGKDKTRPELTDEQIEANFSTWKEQGQAILDFDRIKVVHNADWLDQLNLPDIIKLMSNLTVQQMLERDMFQKRLQENKPIHLHELIYPLLQGYDSVEMEVDLELGGNDQLFNMMVGRQLLQDMKGREKFVLTVPLLVGSDGRKMGKSLNNFIPLQNTPQNMFGELMSISDDVMGQYFDLLTDVPEEEIDALLIDIEDKKVNPIEVKKRLAREIVSWLFSEQEAKSAQDHFEKTVQQGELPDKMPEIDLDQAQVNLLDLVMSTGVCSSKSEGRRLIEQGGVQLDEQKQTDPYAELTIQDGQVLRTGKRNFFVLRIA